MQIKRYRSQGYRVHVRQGEMTQLYCSHSYVQMYLCLNIDGEKNPKKCLRNFVTNEWMHGVIRVTEWQKRHERGGSLEIKIKVSYDKH